MLAARLNSRVMIFSNSGMNDGGVDANPRVTFINNVGRSVDCGKSGLPVTSYPAGTSREIYNVDRSREDSSGGFPILPVIADSILKSTFRGFLISSRR